MPETIKEDTCIKSYESDMVKYSIVVDRRRSLPEVRDGLKPVQRRVLYDMLAQHAEPGKKRVKSSAIVGDTMKFLHPHGDSSIYGTMEPLANWFKCKMPLIDPKGNWGTIMGDDPAAMRYTEARLSPFGYECVIGELAESKSVVDWIDTYQRNSQEPEYLPVKVPLLLINGSYGIGVGLAVSIPPHNLVEVINATRMLIKDPNADLILIPDHCLPCNIIDADWRKIFNTGSGSYKVRGIVEITDYQGYPAVIIRSLPDRVTTDVIVGKLNEMIEKKQLPMVRDILDASANGVVEIIIQLKKGSDPYYVKEVLYSKTKVQDTVSVNFMVVDNINPKRMSYREYILTFLQNTATKKFRLYHTRLQTNLTRYHKLTAYVKLMESGKIDDVIRLIKDQDVVDNSQLIEFLIKKVGLTDLQAEYILQTNISKLAKGYLKQYKEEIIKLEADQKIYEKAVTDDGSFIMNEIDRELAEIAKKYGSKRLCNVIKATDEFNIPRGVFKVVITESNYIRKLSDSDRVTIVRGDQPKFIMRVDNTENLLVFDNMGKVFKVPVYKIPVTERNAPGTDIRIIQKDITANIVSVIYEPMLKAIADGSRKHYLAVVSKGNSIKKIDIEDFLSVNPSGLIYSKVVPGDEIAGVVVTPIDLDVIIYSGHKALRMPTANLPLFKRNAMGSKAMNTNDIIEGISVIYPDANNIITVTSSGMMNKSLSEALARSDRGRAGSTVIKLGKDDHIISIDGANEMDIVRVTMSNGIIEIPVKEIPLYASTSKGSKMIDTSNGIILKVDIIKQ